MESKFEELFKYYSSGDFDCCVNSGSNLFIEFSKANSYKQHMITDGIPLILSAYHCNYDFFWRFTLGRILSILKHEKAILNYSFILLQFADYPPQFAKDLMESLHLYYSELDPNEFKLMKSFVSFLESKQVSEDTEDIFNSFNSKINMPLITFAEFIWKLEKKSYIINYIKSIESEYKTIIGEDLNFSL